MQIEFEIRQLNKLVEQTPLKIMFSSNPISHGCVGDEGSGSDEGGSEEEYEDEDGVKRTRKRRSK